MIWEDQEPVQKLGEQKIVIQKQIEEIGKLNLPETPAKESKMIDMQNTTTKYALYEVFQLDAGQQAIESTIPYEKLLHIYDDFSDAKIVAVSFAKSNRQMKIREFVTEMLDES